MAAYYKTGNNNKNGEGEPGDSLENFAVNEVNKNIRQLEAHYFQMIEEIEDYAIIMLDKNGIVLNWNKGAQRIKGFTKEEIIGKSFENFYPPEDRKKGLPQKLMKQAEKEGKAVTEGWRLRNPGERFWGSIVITALHDRQGNVIGFSKVTRDLTEKKLADDKLKEYSKMLEFQNSELEEFAYATSHDMKEPLRKVHLYNTYILENQSNTLDKKSREFLDRSIDAVKRMMMLIDNILAYSKATSRIENLSKVDLNEIVKEVICSTKDEQQGGNISFDTSKLPVIEAIPFQCKQLFNNLISNSQKYRNPDRQSVITITHQVVKGQEIKNRKAEGKKPYYMISVSDNGIGFEPAYNEKVFEVFQRLNNFSEAKGSGIGLAICKKIMQNHQGFITASGRPGEGACFNLYFPVIPLR
ncbi:sensor histidine kinase [Anseongella ginsenosidimutans]|nr:PAS domain S-box protein [Anseongella ginsenosidimutans]QEC52918.1 PAS domain S-box protein [Anseongella ginsenosidimutans]